MPALEELTYQDYLQMFRRRWRLVAATAAVAALAGLIGARWQVPSPLYDSIAIVRYNPSSGFEATPGAVPPEQGKELVTQVLLMRTLPVAGNAARRLGWIPAGTPRDQLSRFQEPINRVLTAFNATPPPGGQTGLLTIHAWDPSPQTAANVANAVAEAYKDENLYQLKEFVMRRRSFLEREIADNENQLNQALLAFEQYRREHPMAASEPGQRIAAEEAKQQELADRIEETRRQLDLVNAGRPVSDLGLIAIVGARGTTRLTQLSTQYTTLQVERSRMLTELTDAHPLVRAKNQQIESVREGLADELSLIIEAFEKQQEQAKLTAERLRTLEKAVPLEAMHLGHLQHQVKVHEDLGTELNQQLVDTLLKDTGIIGQVTIMASAKPSQFPVNPPPYLRFGELGLAAGLFGGLLIAVLLENARFSIRTLRELETSVDLPVLATNVMVTSEVLASWIPDRGRIRPRSKQWSRALALTNLIAPRSPMSEGIRGLRAALQKAVESGQTSFTVCGVNRGDGATTTVVNLALSFAQAGKRVLVVESDLRNPAISDVLGIAREPGFSDLLQRTIPLDKATRNVADFVTGTLTLEEVLLTPGVDRFHVIPCGQKTANAVELLASAAFAATLDRMRAGYDVILFDSPPLSVAADSILLGRQTAVVLVFSPQRTRVSEVQAAVAQLRKSECRIVGMFVNGMEAEAVVQPEPATAA